MFRPEIDEGEKLRKAQSNRKQEGNLFVQFKFFTKSKVMAGKHCRTAGFCRANSPCLPAYHESKLNDRWRSNKTVLSKVSLLCTISNLLLIANFKKAASDA